MISSTQTNQPFVGPTRSPQEAKQFVTKAIATLRQAGCRITGIRTKLLNIFGQRADPVTVEELHAVIGHEECDLVTVYRNMATFEELGLVARTYRHSGTTLYERKQGVERPYRVVCKISNRVAPISPEQTASLRKSIEEVEAALRAQGYTQVAHVLEFFGVDPSVTLEAKPRGGLER